MAKFNHSKIMAIFAVDRKEALFNFSQIKGEIKCKKMNFTKYPGKNIKFLQMNNLQMSFPNGMFDLISARHTIINAKQIYNALNAKGTLVIEGINKKDCWQLKQVFGRGQAYNDDIAISEKDYKDIKEAGFVNIEKVSILENEYYKTEEDLMALLLKTPILNDFLETNKNKSQNMPIIEMDLFKKYVEKYQTEKGILLERVLYGIVARK